MAKKNKKQTIWYKISRRVWGIGLIIACWAILAAICFYSAGESSFNLANDKVNGVLGLSGSSIAALVLTFFGLSLPVFILVIMFWGYNICRLQPISNFWLRLLAWFLGVGFLAMAFDFLPMNRVGGLFGELVNKKLISKIPAFHYMNPTIAGTSLLLGFLLFNYAIDLSLKYWWNAIKNIMLLLWRGIGVIGKLFMMIFAVRSPKSFEPKSQVEKHKKKSAKEKIERKEPKLSEDSSEPKANNAAKPVNSKIKKQDNDDGYLYPDIGLLSKPKEKGIINLSQKELDAIAQDLENVLQEFGVNGKIVKIRPGPVVTLYELEPAPGTKTARVIGLADDIARSMSAVSVRIAVVAGSNTIGIEMPNQKREIVWLRELFEGEAFKDTKNALNVVLGKDIGGENVYADLAKMPHLLVAGTTGSGKSVGMNSMILSILFRMRPEECKLIMIDPKMLEFSVYNGIPHLLTPVITDPSKAVLGLKWAVKEMENRYRAMAQLNVRNISGYNKKLEEMRNSGERAVRQIQTGFNMETGAPIFEEQEVDLTALPYIVVVVDEMADLMLVAGKEVEAAIQRLAQMARAAGIHLILSTQRPSVDVITGVIKANFPTRISFQVTSKIDSRTILGEQGAEQLLGMGDMLYMPSGQRPIRVHGSFVKDSEVEKIVEYLKEQKEPEYLDSVTEGELNTKDSGSVFDKTAMGGGNGGDEDLYAQAVEIVRNDKKTSISYIQRRLRIGYNRAAMLIEKMEEEGVISAPDHSGKRELL